MREPEVLPTAHRQRLRRPARVLDLPPVHVARGEARRGVLDLRGVREAGLLEERAPDALARAVLQLPEVQRDVNAGEEGFVERRDPVCGEEEDAAVVLDVSQEDGDHCVTLHVGQRALLEEYIGLEDGEVSMLASFLKICTDLVDQ